MRQATAIALLSAAAAMAQDQITDEALDNAKTLTVMIDATIDGDTRPGAGIIFALANDRVYIATANHLVRRATSEASGIKLEFRWLPGEQFAAELLRYYEPDIDLAVIVVRGIGRTGADRAGLPFDRLRGDPSSLAQGVHGAPVWAIGYPDGTTAYDVSAGRISQVEALRMTWRVAGLVPGGYSGGPLVDSNGTIVGMIRQDQPPTAEATRIDLIVNQLKAWNYQIGLAARSIASEAVKPAEAPIPNVPVQPHAGASPAEAKALFNQERYADAIPLFRQSAEAGNAEAMFYMGLFYLNGWGASQDFARARSWFEKAAAGREARAMTNLGYLHEQGLGGFPQDAGAAVTWYRKAADAGDARGMANLGFMYESGRGGLPKDVGEAVKWYRKAADAGDAHGMTNLGVLYESGSGGLPKDAAEAVKWYRKAADAGDAHGMANLGFMYKSGSGGLPKDDGEAVKWYRKAADAGDAHGMTNLGFMYESGSGGLPQDAGEAVKWYRKAADAGYAPGMTNLGFMYESGSGGLPKDAGEAVKWYRKAADAGDAHGMANLGVMYREGRGVPNDDVQAVRWCRMGADAGDAHGMECLGEMYEQGRGGLSKDEGEAMKWYRKAASGGDAYAANALQRLTH